MRDAFEMFSGITLIAEPFRGVLLDAYGVFWGGNAEGVLPGSKEAMENLVSQGKIVGILSNSTQLSPKEILKVETHGIVQGKHFHFFITSGDITRDLLLSQKLPFETPHHKYWLLGKDHKKFNPHLAIFEGTIYTEASTIQDADFIYVSIPHINGEDQTDPELFRKEILLLKDHHLPMLCANPDMLAHEGTPPKAVVRQGTIASLYEQSGGEVFYIGKPYDEAYKAAMKYFEKYQIVEPADILMVGDTPETDIRGARRFGISAALTTKTGIMADRIAHHGLDKALQMLADDDFPHYFIERFNE